MFVFELDEVLFKLAVNRPHFEPLSQLPPCWKTRFTVRLKDLISSFPLLLYVHPLMWGRESPTPP
jgi:hypothetical protein